ncbi:hypothetical protein BH10PSE2_BH10PSE2_02800 [soil metagenome]
MLALAIAALLSVAPASNPAHAQAQTAAMKLEPAMMIMAPTLAKAVDVPPPAAPSGIRVRLRCVAQSDGLVGGCRVIDETRPGLGFGDAAIALMNGTSADPAWRQGQGGEGSFEHTIDFTP